MFLHNLYVYLTRILGFKLLGKHRLKSILFFYLNVRRQGSSHTLNVWKRRKDRNGISFPLIVPPCPSTFGLNFFPRPLLYAIPCLITHQPLFFPLQKTTPLWIFILLCSHGNSSPIAPLSFLSLSPHPIYFCTPRAYPSPWLVYVPFLFSSQTLSHVIWPHFVISPYCYFRRIFLFVLSDTRTVSISLYVLYFILISLSEDWQTE